MPFTLKHRGKVVANVQTLDEALRWLHANQPASAKEAVTAGGYSVVDGFGKRWFEPRKRV